MVYRTISNGKGLYMDALIVNARGTGMVECGRLSKDSLYSHANNLTNINKTNNYLSSQLIKHDKDQDVGNSCSGLGQTQTCDGVKPLNGIITYPF